MELLDRKPFIDPPILETERLKLRKLTMADAPDILSYASDPEVLRYSIGDPHADLAASEQFIQSALDLADNSYGGLWGITLKPNDKVIGTCGYEVWIPVHYRAEIGYSLSREWWNQGIMTEAIAELLKFGLTTLELNRFEAVCHPSNAASYRVLEKLGFEREGFLRQHVWSRDQFFDTYLYAALAQDLRL